MYRAHSPYTAHEREVHIIHKWLVNAIIATMEIARQMMYDTVWVSQWTNQLL